MIIDTRTTPSSVGMDTAHTVFIAGCIMAMKPARILELGIGRGEGTRLILEALKFNGCGKLDSVDNWVDTKGREPHFVQDLPGLGANVIVSGEESFVERTPDNTYDFLISDADHYKSHSWLDQHIRITRPGAFLFFHDTNNPSFPNLYQLVERTDIWSQYHFTKNSRPGERCDRGLLFVINQKE